MPNDKTTVELAELQDIEIFEAGTYRGKAYTEEDLARMVRNFEKHGPAIKPVAVVGHSEDQKLLQDSGIPAAGWMTTLKQAGKKLLASFRDVPKVIADLVNRKAYGRISSEIYNDYEGDGLAIRRVALLGGEIPEVKTLQDVLALYADNPKGETTWVTLSETDPEPAAPPAAAPAAGDGTNVPPDGGKEITDMDMEKLAEQVATLSEGMVKLQEENKAKDSQIAALQEKNQETATKLSETQKQKRREDINRFLEDLTADGKLSPALRFMGLDKFMQGLDDSAVVKFGEKTEVTPYGFMMRFLKAIPKNSILKLGELANPDGDPNKPAQEKVMYRSDFSELPAQAQADFVKKGGKIID